MKTSPKAFDCVAMKDRIQARLMAEYESRKGEFKSFAEFVAATVQEDEWGARQWARIAERPDDG